MQIKLNTGLEELSINEQSEHNKDYIRSRILAYILDKQKQIDGISGQVETLVTDLDKSKHIQYGYLNTLSTAYSRHRNVILNPHDLWFIVLSEIADYVNEHSEQCAPIFTNGVSGKKTVISVPTNDVSEIDPTLIVNELSNHFPTYVFIPSLSTAGKPEMMAMCAALSGGVQRYYQYMTFMCGIPEVKVGGTSEDWQTLLGMTAEIAMMFKTAGINDMVLYLVRVADILDEIQRSFFMDRTEFWQNIFTQKNVGSGGQLNVNGWFTKLYFKEQKEYRIDTIQMSIATLRFQNIETKREFIAGYGGFYMVEKDGFLTTEYGHTVHEVTSNEFIKAEI